ncbi:MAG TPA: hypothetical protein VJR24_00960 [Gemmatimonadaceae bacterium]|nr:hypothetical protein [Gaiellaceae bacterium]HKT06435.1 hypothetical protein [Gemmatimonadaceae bacterium]
MHAEVVEAGLQAGEPVLAAFGRELALLEGFVVALQGLLGASDLGGDRHEPPLELRPSPLSIGVRTRECVTDDLLVAVERGELVDDRVFDLLAREAFAVAGLRAVLLAARAGVVVVAAAVAVRAHADVRLAALSAAKKAGEDEVGGVAPPLGVLAALTHDRLGLRKGELVDERLVHAVEDLVAPADLPDIGRVVDDPVHRRMPPPCGRRGCAFVAQLLRDRPRPEPLARVQVEDALDDWRLDRVRDEHSVFA